MMPGMDGYEVCRRIREQPETAYLPVVMVTASGDEEKVRALEAGADDFLTKPIDQGELLARVASLARIKRYQDTIRRQAAELAAWNRELEARVETQVAAAGAGEPPAPLPVAAAGRADRRLRRRVVPREPPPRDRGRVLRPARQFTPFAESSEPEEVMGVLSEYHDALGDLIFRFEGTLERFTGDGLMVFFNDPVPCDDAGLARDPDGRRDAHAGPRPGRVVGAPGPRPRVRRRDRPGLRDARARSASRAASTTRRSAASPTSRPACAPSPSRGRSSSPSGCFTGAGTLVVGEEVGDLRAAAASAGRVRAFSVKGVDNVAGRVMTGDLWTGAGTTPPDVLSVARRGGAVPALRRAAGAHAARLGRDAAEPTRTSRWWSSRRSRSTGSASGSGSMTQAYEERFLFLLLLLRSRGCAWST